jgi:hypothetical protein
MHEHGLWRSARPSWRASRRARNSPDPPMNTARWLGVAFVFLLIAEARPQAYLDPGSGSMLVQLLLGGVAGLGVILKLSWLRLRGWITASRRARRPDR